MAAYYPNNHRHFDYTDYYRYIVNENPYEPQYSRGESKRNYEGRGPKNYDRSSERIMEDVNARLTDDPQLDASGIEVQVNSHGVILSGFAPDRVSKRRAYDIAESVRGVKNVENRIRISND
jgi:osmotically-inducible protein OsmY